MRVLMIIPAYNEENSIVSTVKSLSKANLKGDTLDYVIINDGSKDMTWPASVASPLPLQHRIRPCYRIVGQGTPACYLIEKSSPSYLMVAVKFSFRPKSISLMSIGVIREFRTRSISLAPYSGENPSLRSLS